MNLIVVIGAVAVVTGITVLLVGVLRRTGSNNHLTVADIQARLAREEDIDTITGRAVAAPPPLRPLPQRRPGMSRPAVP